MSTNEIASLLDNSKDLDRLRKEQEDVLLEINKIHKKLQTTPEMAEKSVDALLLKLRALYVQAKELSENELNVSNALVSQLDALLQSGLSAAQRKKIEFLAIIIHMLHETMFGTQLQNSTLLPLVAFCFFMKQDCLRLTCSSL